VFTIYKKNIFVAVDLGKFNNQQLTKNVKKLKHESVAKNPQLIEQFLQLAVASWEQQYTFCSLVCFPNTHGKWSKVARNVMPATLQNYVGLDTTKVYRYLKIYCTMISPRENRLQVRSVLHIALWNLFTTRGCVITWLHATYIKSNRLLPGLVKKDSILQTILSRYFALPLVVYQTCCFYDISPIPFLHYFDRVFLKTVYLVEKFPLK